LSAVQSRSTGGGVLGRRGHSAVLGGLWLRLGLGKTVGQGDGGSIQLNGCPLHLAENAGPAATMIVAVTTNRAEQIQNLFGRVSIALVSGES